MEERLWIRILLDSNVRTLYTVLKDGNDLVTGEGGMIPTGVNQVCRNPADIVQSRRARGLAMIVQEKRVADLSGRHYNAGRSL